jgi:hypothetical protein
MSNCQIKVENGTSNIKDPRDRPQWGVLSPPLWSFVTDLDSQGYEVFGFVDDILIMVRCKVDSVLQSCQN